MELQKSGMGRTRRSEIDCERKRKYGQYESGSQPVHQSRSPIKDPSFGVSDRAHRSAPQIDWHAVFPGCGTRHGAKLIRYDEKDS
jgi:hypothetical protein